MAASDTEICNMSLSHIGAGEEIADLELEDSEAAKACRRFYPTALETVFRDYDWAFARRTIELGLVGTLNRANGDEFNYSYRYPGNVARVRRIPSGTRVDTRETAIPFQISHDNSGKLILTDAGANYYYPMTKVFAVVTVNDVPTEFYPSDFVLTFSYLLASLIAPRLGGDEGVNLSAKMLQKYFLSYSNSSKNDAGEVVSDIEYDSEFVRVRN